MYGSKSYYRRKSPFIVYTFLLGITFSDYSCFIFLNCPIRLMLYPENLFIFYSSTVRQKIHQALDLIDFHRLHLFFQYFHSLIPSRRFESLVKSIWLLTIMWSNDKNFSLNLKITTKNWPTITFSCWFPSWNRSVRHFTPTQSGNPWRPALASTLMLKVIT